jgi:lipopolysaccharide cholinephosphotransferase
MNNEIAIKYAQLDLLLELKRICEKYSIDYFLVGGTLIGAVRHKGFIPWDDDIDVGMLRNQYLKFIKACKEDLNSNYFLHDWNMDKASPLPFLKLKIKGTHYRETLSRDSQMGDEIYIDIFPYDNASDNLLSQKVQAIKNVVIKKMLLLKCGFTIDEGGKLKKIYYVPLKLFSHMRSIEGWKKSFDRNAQKYNDRLTKNVISLGGSYSYFKELKSRELLSHYTKLPFEGTEFSVPKEYDRFLKEVYGNYMQLPPIDQRVSRHGIIMMDIGSYKIRSSAFENNI